MKIKRMAKRLFAVGSGVAMLGATAMGAMAADLSQYPEFFVTPGTTDSNYWVVVGDDAAAVDNLAATDIVAGMMIAGAEGGSGTSTTTTVTGDAWMVGTSSKKFEMANNANSSSNIYGENFRSISNFVGDDELDALADGEWSTNEQNYGYQQFLFFYYLTSP